MLEIMSSREKHAILTTEHYRFKIFEKRMIRLDYKRNEIHGDGKAVDLNNVILNIYSKA